MKKLMLSSIALSVMTASSLAMAASAPVASSPSSFSGVFGGVDLGFRAITYKLVEGASGNGFGQDTDSEIHSFTQATQGLHVGYGHQFTNNVYLGVVATAKIAQGRDQHSHSSQYFGFSVVSTHDFQFSDQYGVDVNLGYAFTPRFLAYIAGGWRNLHVKDTTSYTADGIPVGEFFIPNLSGHVNGGDVGLGVKYLMTQHVVLGAEYNESFYGKIKSDKNLAAYGGPVVSRSVQPKYVSEGTFSLGYLFNV